jgi:PadR family transcriptional regulator PadR
MVVGNAQLSLHDNLSLELRRGALVLAVLVELRREEYGYSLKKLLSDKGLEIDEGTLYPLLRRLESQGLLKSAWRVEDGRPRRYYQASGQGERLSKELSAEWRALAGVIGKLIG